MGSTPTHKITYPEGSASPNVPVHLQTLSESVEAALNKITKSAAIVCHKLSAQRTHITENVWTDVIWETEVLKQGITHAASSALFIVPDSGLYQINVRLAFQDARPNGALIVNVNGVDRAQTRTDESGVNGVFPKPAVVYPLKLTAGDVVKVRMRANFSSILISGAESFFELKKQAIY